jgi:hypothetical protein
MLDDDDDSHMSREREKNKSWTLIALINLDNLYFVRNTRRMILNPKKERTRLRGNEANTKAKRPAVPTIVELVSSKPTYHPKNR